MPSPPRAPSAPLRAALALLCLLAPPAVAQDLGGATRVVALRSAAQPYAEVVAIRGRTEADRRVELRAELSGLVISTPIRKGAQVKAGDVLCRLDPGERPAALAEAEAELRQAEAEVAASRRLSERGFTAETEALTREAQLEAARARLLRARIDLDRLAIVAPFDGVLETDTAETGGLLQPGSLCATLLALDPIAVVGYAAERDVDRLTVGAPAQARLVTGRRIEGDIRFVARSADEQTRTFRVEIAAPNPDLAIRDGMTAEITVALPPRAAHFAPQSALTLDDAGRLGVRLAVEDRARFAPVEILADVPDGVWLAGLPRDAAIIVVGQEFVDDGAPVAPSYVAEDAVEALRRELP
ncbi:MAG: efflux RND transporter periplasmic adaptor subunit [Rubrimonas sp.]|uniref:efflux RND transporter periplasmic adaptor subunit n=1 Tax=Rubrimonas sp. TaxID=2036015 RepID=UPI002FDD70DE